MWGNMIILFMATFIFLFVGSPFASAQEVYYCMDEITNGIIKRKTGIWERTGITPERYTIKFNEDYTELKGLHKLDTTWDCHISYGGYVEGFSNVRICYYNLHSGEVFTFDIKTLRYLYLIGVPSGYVENRQDTNSLHAGTCKKF